VWASHVVLRGECAKVDEARACAVGRILYKGRTSAWEAVSPSQIDVWRHLCPSPVQCRPDRAWRKCTGPVMLLAPLCVDISPRAALGRNLGRYGSGVNQSR
jgi:hypothetical protein